MNIEFNQKIKRYFDDLNDVQGSKHLMERKIGLNLTHAVKRRYNQLLSFTDFSKLMLSGIGDIESLKGDMKGLYSMTISGNYRLVIEPVARDLSAESLKICDTVKIREVVDYHGKGSKKNRLIP